MALRGPSLKAADVPVSFDRQILPILSDTCFPCHGPDAATRRARLRLDLRTSATADRDGTRVLVPGDADQSELIRRIFAEDEADRMPPPEATRKLSLPERTLLRRWIDEGAHYESHWSFTPITRPALPPDSDRLPVRNAIDRFVNAQFGARGLLPEPEADRTTLIRRLSLDLTGLPPTHADVDAFVASESPTAYEELVDRLLASPRYGERMAVDWLDAARYADTHGYLFDTERSMWRWRDWAIAAFNANQPFDDFTIEQLAGDLLPGATEAQQIASGFNRNHIINNEAGAIPEEYFVENIVDRINTTATVWMGLSLACAQCHDHKYDPVSQREYYQLYAFFHNVPEEGLDGINSNARPLMSAPTADQRRRLVELDSLLETAQREFAPLVARLGPQQTAWEAGLRRTAEAPTCGLQLHLALDGDVHNGASTGDMVRFRDGEAVYQPGLFGEGALLDSQRHLDLGDTGDFDRHDAFTLAAWVYPNALDDRGAIFSRMLPPEAGFRGYSLQLVGGQLNLFLVHSFPDNLLQIETQTALEPQQWRHVLVTYDGSGRAEGARILIDGAEQEVSVSVNTLTGSFQVDRPLLVGTGHPEARFAGVVDEVRVYDRVLQPAEILELPGLALSSFLAVPAAARNPEQTRRIQEEFLVRGAPAEWRAAFQRVERLQDDRTRFENALPTVMVMHELDEPRETRLLVRGAYNRPAEVVTAGTPAFLPPLDADLPRNRLGLARWLVDRRHPLTARVAVNRLWQLHFGAGLVRTTENFGLQGEAPSHPELLDWLAVEFLENGWNVKELQRLLLTSAAYRRSSNAGDAARRADPGNRWLARGPRPRLAAEFVRDGALAASGLLVEQVGGPSVRPYMLAELWREVAFDTTGKILSGQIYLQDQGESLYRRSLYTFWKRTAPPPTLLLFDAPDRERCVVRRDQTNTPLQALALMNDPTFVEASRRLAERMLAEGGDTPLHRLSWGFQAVTGRRPGQTEVEPLRQLLVTQHARFRRDPRSASDLLEVGDSRPRGTFPPEELAAYTVVANVLLNLDEAVTRR